MTAIPPVGSGLPTPAVQNQPGPSGLAQRSRPTASPPAPLSDAHKAAAATSLQHRLRHLTQTGEDDAPTQIVHADACLSATTAAAPSVPTAPARTAIEPIASFKAILARIEAGGQAPGESLLEIHMPDRWGTTSHIATLAGHGAGPPMLTLHVPVQHVPLPANLLRRVKTTLDEATAPRVDTPKDSQRT